MQHATCDVESAHCQDEAMAHSVKMLKKDSHAARKAALRPPLIVYAITPQGISSDAALMFMPVLCSVCAVSDSDCKVV
eukprot:9317-Heterococcus_DN1.PRE.3